MGFFIVSTMISLIQFCSWMRWKESGGAHMAEYVQILDELVDELAQREVRMVKSGGQVEHLKG